MLNRVKEHFRKQSDFKKSFITLMSGAFLSQLIPILIAPLLTRLYTPTDFGIYTLIISIATFGSIIATGRYEIAIMLPEKESEAFSLFILSVLLTAVFSVLSLIVIILFKNDLAILLGLSQSEWLYVIPFLIFLTAAYQSVNFWVNRQKKFKIMTSNRVGRSAVSSFSQVAIGKLGNNSGLIWGTLISQMTSFFFLVRNIYPVHPINKEDIEKTAKRYIKFPKYALWADGINSLSNQLPVFFLLSFFSAEAGGQYGLTLRILGLPIALISSAVLDVFKQRASEDFYRDGNCEAIYLKTLKGLLIVAIPGFAFLYFIAPFLFSFVFGEQWRTAGEYAQILSVMFLFKFVASPLSYVLYIAEKQQYDLIWQISLLFVTVLAFYIGKETDSVLICMWLFSIGYTVLYLIYIILSYKLSKGSRIKYCL